MKLRIALLLVLVASLSAGSIAAEDDSKSDEQQILDHIHGIFKAFIREDWETVRKTHTEDWTGLKMHSTEIIRGIDGYMEGVYTRKGKMLAYEIKDSEVQVYGDIAIVYYIAEMTAQNAAGYQAVIPIRSVDIYRKDAHGWNQAGSHLSLATSSAHLRQLYEIMFSDDDSK